ncbi:hypothetical protein AU375_04878 [Methylobacterium radiotolerans]|nr:hypothetical protein AU375_04878 [Methylobacterium radiotolerans]
MGTAGGDVVAAGDFDAGAGLATGAAAFGAAGTSAGPAASASGSTAGAAPSVFGGSRHAKASRRPVTGETGAQVSVAMPSAIHTRSRGARAALASHSRA